MEQLIPNKIEESSLNINIKYLNYYLEKIESLFKDDKFLKSFELVKLISIIKLYVSNKLFLRQENNRRGN